MIHTSLFLALLLALGFLCQWVAWRVRLPAILFLLISGLLLGPVLGWLDPDDLMGDLLFPFVSLGVAVILFEGSLSLRLEEARGVGRAILNLVTIGVLVTVLVVAAAAHYLADLSWSLALLLGAICSVTGPTVVIPMLRSIRPDARVANILRWEGIIIDPIGALLAVLVFEAVVVGHETESLVGFLRLVGFGVIIGVLGAFLLRQILKRHLAPDYLLSYASLALVLVAFTISNSFAEESGLLAVTVMGVVLTNLRDVHVEDILDFKEDLTVVLISLLFIVLAARLEADVLLASGVQSLLILGVVLFVARPLAVLISSIGTSLKLREGVLISWIAPRGIVAAAVASLFSIRLEEVGVEGAELIVPLTFAVIIGTVVVQSATAGWLARKLGLARAEPQGVMIVGANRVALAVAGALQKAGIEVLVCDPNWDQANEARMAGFNTYYGSPLSDHADVHLDLTGITRLFAMSRSSELNTLVTTRYRPDFGANRVYVLSTTAETETPRSRSLALALQVPELFGRKVTWSSLASMLGQGAKIKTTKITESYTFEDYRAKYGSQARVLFALDAQERLRVETDEAPLEPEAGWTVAAIVSADKIDEPVVKPDRNPEPDLVDSSKAEPS